jgi:hypothetical protein
MTQTLVYQYSNLEENYIRIFFLKIDEEDEPLSGHIGSFSLANLGDYLALSYAWGDQVKNHVVSIDGRKLAITASLFHALNDIRASKRDIDGPVPIWADAICINQADSSEKCLQIPLMKEIYEKASMVVTYIGPAAKHSEAGLKLAGNLIKFDKKMVVTRGRSPLRFLRFLETDYESHGLPLPSDPAFAGLQELMNRSWSSRAWMVQESLLNNTLVMLCGRTAVEWLTLLHVAHLALSQLIPKY